MPSGVSHGNFGKRRQWGPWKARTQARPPLERFLEKTEPDTNGGCWLWTAFINKGYGRFRAFQVVEDAHRVAWKLFKGEIPADLQVLHKCDIPSCVNPAHLFLGTQADNVHDMVYKGRARGRLSR